MKEMEDVHTTEPEFMSLVGSWKGNCAITLTTRSPSSFRSCVGPGIGMIDRLRDALTGRNTG